ncbi:hypothetical protein JTB14_013371 [Gonioctena quinquepunctata]|nr:hypothetical protein JTB14_013371 [Gonioctena quinquepunctata]
MTKSALPSQASRVSCTIACLELMMPRYAMKEGDVVLKCEHSVTPEQLYKVEWRKGENKIFQYIKGRKPPFRYYPTSGVKLDVSRFHYFALPITFTAINRFTTQKKC